MYSLEGRHLYLCVPCREDLADFLPAVLAGGVDVVQLREKDLDDPARIAAARVMVPICHEFDVPFIMNDSPELAQRVGADGVHVGQEDVAVERCRELLGPDALIGLSTHRTEEFEASLTRPATYLSAGPIVATPTKPGREGTGLDYAVDCQRRSARPVFVTGGVTTGTVGHLVEAGLRHFVVVRALTEAADPGRAARALRDELDRALSAVPVEPT